MLKPVPPVPFHSQNHFGQEIVWSAWLEWDALDANIGENHALGLGIGQH